MTLKWVFTGPSTGTGAEVTKVPRLVATFETDVDTSVRDFVKVDGDNFVTRILSNTNSDMPNGIFGIGYNKLSSTEIEVIFMGILGGYSGLTTGLPIFVNTSGQWTHSIPSTGNVQQIGFAISQTEIFFNLMQTQRRVS